MWNSVEGYGWGWMGLGMIGMVLFWALIIVAIVVLVRWLGGLPASSVPPPALPPSKTAIDILKERYARGEIGKEEFERIKRDIE